MNQVYLDTARLMIQIAPMVFADNVFALKGGTAINQFVPGYEYTGLIGLQVTGGTPRPIIVGLNQELNAALKAPEVMKVLTADGSNVTPGTPEDLQRVVEKSLDMAEQLVKKLNLKLD